MLALSNILLEKNNLFIFGVFYIQVKYAQKGNRGLTLFPTDLTSYTIC